MWRILDHQVVHEPHGNDIQVPIMVPDWSSFEGDVRTVAHPTRDAYLGYDAWLSGFSPEEEHSLVQQAINDAVSQHIRIHIRGLSSHESIAFLREYYRDQGYEDVFAKNYTLPSTELLTASISLRHSLWCEKDKDFLGTRDDHGAQYGCTVPPLRSPADLRVLQQALRMGIVMGIEVDSDNAFLPQILEKQILPPFHIGQMTCFRWEKHGFSGQKIYFSFPMPSL